MVRKRRIKKEESGDFFRCGKQNHSNNHMS
jgi:hypothetical protein